jgi:hypothetical protein
LRELLERALVGGMKGLLKGGSLRLLRKRVGLAMKSFTL